MGVGARGATLEIQLVADVARLKSDMAAMQSAVANATGGATRSFTTMASGTGAAAAQMAAAAQTSARAAVAHATGLKSVSAAAHLSTLELRETLVATRELYSGNFTRLPGSLTLLGQSIRDAGGARAYGVALLSTLGILKTVQNTELAEAAAQKAATAAAVESAAERAASAVVARQAQVAIAQAQLAAAETAEAEAAAQTMLTKALRSVEVAAGRAAIAQDALATAQAESAAAQAEAAAASRTMIGGTGVGLLGIGTVAAIAYGAIKQFQNQVKDSGELDAFAEKLDLTDAQIKNLGGSVTYLGHNIKEVHGLTVTFGDVMYGVWHELWREVSNPGPWNALQNAATSAFSSILAAWNKVSAGISAGLMFIIDAGKAALNGSLFTGGFDAMADIKRRYADELKRNAAAFGGIEASAIAHRRKTMQDLADANNPSAPKHQRERKESDHGLADALAKLAAEIKGQYDLAAAYGVSAAAAQRAEAAQKAAEDAISHKGKSDQFYALELQKIVATDVARQAKENAGLQTQLSIRAQLNGEIADGTITISQYNDKLALQTKLNALNADLENADAAHKAVIKKLIQDTIDLETQDLQLKAQINALTQEAANDNEIARIRLENSLMGASNKERAAAIAQLEAMQKLKEIDPNGLLTKGERDKFVLSEVSKALAGVQTEYQKFAASVPQSADAINQALQGIAFKGLDDLNNGLADAIVNSKSLGEVFHNVAAAMLQDLIKLALQEAEMAILKQTFGAAAGGSFANGGVFSGGNVVPFASGGVVSGPSFFPMSGGRTGLMGEAGEEAVMPLTRDSHGRLGVRAANSNGITVVNNNDFRGADPDAVGAISARIDQMEARLPGQIVATVSDAKQRFIIR